MPYYTHVGLRLWYECDGDGPAVLLLHGIGASARDWDFQLPALLPGHTVIRLDLRGHGRSDSRGLYTIEDMASDAAALLEQFGPEPAHVIGHSLGGAVALALALGRPGAVRSLTLANTFAHFKATAGPQRSRAARRLTLLARGDLPALNAFIADGLFPGDDLADLRAGAVERLNGNLRPDSRRVLWRTLLAIARFDVRGRLGRIAAPTLVAIAGRDTTVAPSCSEELAAGIPLARRFYLPGASHALPMECPQAFNEAWLSFTATL